MDTYSSIIWMLGILGAIFGIGMLRRHMEMIVNFVLRGILGLFVIYFVNYFFAERLPELTLGYNFLNFLASGLLGFPGVMMLYGIRMYMLW